MAPMMDENPTKNNPAIHNVCPRPEITESGGYVVHPPAAIPDSKPKPAMSSIAAGIFNQNENIFNVGNAISSVPIINGIAKFPMKPFTMGMITRNNMMAPCMVSNCV